jgi:protein TonB
LIISFFKTQYNSIEIPKTSANSTSQKNKVILNFNQFKDVKIITKKEVDRIRKQIVQTRKSDNDDIDSKSRFSGEHNQSFSRQTVARVVDTFNEGKKGESFKKTTAQKENHKPATGIKSLSLESLGTFEINKDELNAKEIAEKLEKELEEGSINGKEGARKIASSNDFIEDIPLGDVTNLNTTENKYFGFYLRIKQKLEQYWGSNIHSKARNLYKSGRRLPASENLITAITVVLNDKGNILDIKIEGTSGVRELDQAAVDSFNKAGPFPNPPKGLLIGGRAVISWGFVVKS